MISQETFSNVISALEARYDRTIADLDKDIWFDYFNANLSDNELMDAYGHATVQLTYLPSAEWLVSVIKGSKDALANQEWKKVLKNSPSHVNEPLIISERGKEALASIGGLQAIRESEVVFLDNKRKSFVELWHQGSPEVETVAEIRAGKFKAIAPAAPVVDYVQMMADIVAKEEEEMKIKIAAMKAKKASDVCGGIFPRKARAQQGSK